MSELSKRNPRPIKLSPKTPKNDESEAPEVRDEKPTNAWRDLSPQSAAIIEAFDGLLYICSQDYEIEFMNKQSIDRTGHNAVGQKCYKALHDLEDVCPWCVNDSVFRGETVRWEIRSPKDNRWYYVVNTPIRNSDGSMSKMAMIQDITERKETEEALRQAEENYRSIFENAVEGIFRSSPDGRLIYVNPAFAKIFGYQSPEEVLASITDIDHQIYVDPDRRAIFKRLMEESGRVRGFEHQAYRKDRSRMWISIKARAVKDGKGAVHYYEGFIDDITARKEAEESLNKARHELERKVEERTRELAQANEELRSRLAQLERTEAALQTERQRLYALLDGLPVGVHLVAPDYTIRFANRTFWETFGGKNTNHHCYELIHGSEKPCGDCHSAQVFETGIPQRFEDNLPNGMILQVSSYPFADLDGSPLVLTMGIDITEQKLAEEKLQDSENRFRQLIEQAADAIFLHDQGRIIEVNQRACDSLGYTREELLNMSVLDLEVENASEDLIRNWQQGIAPLTISGTHRRKDGSTFPVEVRAGNIDYGGRRLRLALVRDISERRQAELALKESEEKYRLLVRQIPAVVYQGYTDWRVDFFDRKAEPLTGHLIEEFNSGAVKWVDLIVPEDLAEARRIFIAALRGDGSYVRCYRIKSKVGGMRWIQERGQIYCDDAGKIEYVKGVFFDITERQQAEMKLQQSEQDLHYLAGQLLTAQERERQRISRDLHDDLGQSLLLLKLQLRVIEKAAPDNAVELKQDLLTQITAIDDIVDNVRRFSRDLRPGVLDDLGLMAALKHLLEDFRALHNIQFSLDLDDVGEMLSPQAQIIIYRIFQESLTNIGKYAQASRVAVKIKQENGEISFSVEDNGKGFDLAQVRSLDVAKRGLGLTSMEERVRMMGGTFEISSRPGDGTRIAFRVRTSSVDSSLGAEA
ncbi:MAG: PAS domain S-box protein [Deltaproteobacteria bacterium]|nr:PAS domain S-box protein [Deltaproteobacteria bacterium]